MADQFIWVTDENATPVEYRIYITSMSLPKIQTPWTKVELGAGVYSFRRNQDISVTFDMSGYISSSDAATTRTMAEELNANLLLSPSGTLIDGFGTSYSVYVDSWQISPTAGVNKYPITMSFTIVGV
jgi:hypothetical protein